MVCLLQLVMQQTQLVLKLEKLKGQLQADFAVFDD